MIEKIERWRCDNCEGWHEGDPAAYVNNIAWCNGCVRRLKHWWAWLIPTPPTNGPTFVLWGFGLLVVLFILGTMVGPIVHRPISSKACEFAANQPQHTRAV